VNHGVEVFFAPLSYQSAIWNSVPTVTTIADLAVFKVKRLQHNRKAQIIERLLLKKCAQKSKALLAVSESTKRDLIEVTGVDAAKVTVTLLAPFLHQHEAVVLEKRKPYILFVGTLEPRKNIRGLFHAYAKLPAALQTQHPLMLVGKQGWGGEDYAEMAASLGIAQHVEFKGYVTTEELADLYTYARLFVYPSLYEGFGLPVAEAMAAGTPVVTSNISSLPEVVGDAGIVCDPHSTEQIAQAMARYLQDEVLWKNHQARALRHSEIFTWEKTAEETLEVLAAASLSNSYLQKQ
jgi:glycosyltransferase involved in cell wall biosynthesis